MPVEAAARVVRELTSRGYNAEREAVTLLARAGDLEAAVETTVDAAPADALTISAEQVRTALDDPTVSPGITDTTSGNGDAPSTAVDPSISTGTATGKPDGTDATAPVETKGVGDDGRGGTAASSADAGRTAKPSTGGSGRSPSPPTVEGDVTGRSTGTGEYGDFVSVFKNRFKKLSRQLKSRVNHRPTEALAAMPGGSEAAIVGMVNDVRSTSGGHWLVELEDTSGTFPALVMKDKAIAEAVEELLLDEVIAIEGVLSSDGEILFADAIHFPDVPRTFNPSTADRRVDAALVSDVHVGSQEFEADAWSQFASWLHEPEAESVEYLLVAGDMVEGVGVYPNQDEELDVVDVYDQYEAFAEYLKEVPGEMEIVMIPGNHDAVRLAEPQPGFDEELRGIMSAHDAAIHGNPSTVTVEGVSVLMYHGVSLDEVIADLPAGKASYDEPHRAMFQLLKKRHVAPQYGGRTRLAPEERDYLVIETVPDVFHTGHVHKMGVGRYHNVVAVNTGCWQAQTAFQKSVNIDPDVGLAAILELDTLDLTWRKFA